ncbi:SLAP domain-containing protein [Clostridium botulinum]|uniref:SLAP domain-containing protein n=1 Tax=Clostridium botulinum C/D str. DC5 TaxID=1443128 RepID=A0A0A0I6D3_CLOBO|nr:SLAP domain-containing protein [Clostridium botulinum]KEI05573.1 hypothetical protein Z952_05015 [Clostridium botulinum C/D str. BKT75002]KEI09672.1 hypothetical protein Z954_11935 [Clostridium botulinum C/D str. BKT2873]KGM95072.1 hypothetical protein Z956_05855 [Clostridium botulinum D str. CCUG 7971]KGM96407.1 hypothetical protein Z955_13115 [Clostridium botulinum C/D str. DC5]KOC49245.1 hypothetical protein ADU88_06485 [Clostridium botulinum]
MKRMVAFIISFIFFLTGCAMHNKMDSSNTSLENKEISKKNQKYSFGPIADLSKISDKKKIELQNSLNSFGDVPNNVVTFNPINAYYNDDGSLAIDLFVRNGHKEAIFNIDVNLKLIKDGKVIASAPFSFVKEEFGVIESNNSRPWTILYYPEDIHIKDVKLDSYVIEGENIQYEY